MTENMRQNLKVGRNQDTEEEVSEVSVGLFEFFERAVNYIEDHLYESITDFDVASYLSIPESVFRRFFVSIAGMTTAEYMKNRRMSFAGQETVLTDIKIIDLAYRYGYATPESFTKAFTRYHGISPLKARRAGGSCRAFAPFSVRNSVEGGAFSCEIFRNSGYEFLAKTMCFSKPTAQQEEENVSSFWNSCVEDGTLDCLWNISQENGAQIFSFQIPVSDKLVKYGIGILCGSGEEAEKLLNSENMTEFERIHLPYSVWAAFPCEGRNEVCIRKTKRLIRETYLPSSAFENAAGAGSYVYQQGYRMHEYYGKILIPVKYSGRYETQAAAKLQGGKMEGSSLTIHKSKGGTVEKEHRMKTVLLHGRDIGSRQLWKILLHLTKGLEESKLWYHIDGKSLIFAHGIDIPISRIGVTFPWKEESEVRKYFAALDSQMDQKTADYSFSQFKYFDVQFEGFPVRCMFYGQDGSDQTKEEFQKNAEPILVSGQVIMVQRLEFYMRYAEEEELILKIKEYLTDHDLN